MSGRAEHGRARRSGTAGGGGSRRGGSRGEKQTQGKGKAAFGVVVARAPATIANLGPGFDCMGLALAGPGDEVEAFWAAGGDVLLESVEGVGARDLPLDPKRNCASVAARSALRLAKEKRGVALRLRKGLAGGSGLGSSSASSVAGAVAVHRLLGEALSPEDLLLAALSGEEVASGAAHPDNVAPALLGGLVLVRSLDPVECVRVEVPRGAWFAVVRPHRAVRTEDARRVLPRVVALPAAIENCRNAAALILAAERADLALWGRATVDRIAEPARAPLLPGLAEAKSAALSAGALGVSVSGSGPALFALCDASGAARQAAAAMAQVFRARGIECDEHVLQGDNQGALGWKPRAAKR